MSICTDGIDNYSKKKDKIEESFIKSFEDNFLEEDDYMSIDKELTISSPAGTVVDLDDNTDVLKLPAGVLIRTYKSNYAGGGVAIHTVYLTNEQYFGAHVSLEKKA